MRHAAILDVLRAVTDVAARHPEIQVWWYAPARRLRLAGERTLGPSETFALEIVVETATPESVDCSCLAVELQRKLPGSEAISVRLHRGAGEKLRLFRLKSREGSVAEGRSAVAGDLSSAGPPHPSSERSLLGASISH